MNDDRPGATLTVFSISIGPLVMCLIVDAFGGVLFVVVVVA